MTSYSLGYTFNKGTLSPDLKNYLVTKNSIMGIFSATSEGLSILILLGYFLTFKVKF